MALLRFWFEIQCFLICKDSSWLTSLHQRLVNYRVGQNHLFLRNMPQLSDCGILWLRSSCVLKGLQDPVLDIGLVMWFVECQRTIKTHLKVSNKFHWCCYPQICRELGLDRTKFCHSYNSQAALAVDDLASKIFGN